MKTHSRGRTLTQLRAGFRVMAVHGDTPGSFRKKAAWARRGRSLALLQATFHLQEGRFVLEGVFRSSLRATPSDPLGLVCEIQRHKRGPFRVALLVVVFVLLLIFPEYTTW